MYAGFRNFKKTVAAFFMEKKQTNKKKLITHIYSLPIHVYSWT